MDLDYDISTMALPLQTLCSMTVAYQVLQGSGKMPADKLGHDAVNSVALNRVRKLSLPQRFVTMIEKFILPISAELHYWYHQLGLGGHPILTSQGTVDVVRSSKAIAEDQKEDKLFRFIVACTFCHERLIFEIGKKLNAVEIATIENWTVDPRTPNKRLESWRLLAKLWLDVYSSDENGFTESIIRARDVPLEICNRGFEIAINCRNEVAMKYFIDQGSPEEIERSIANASFGESIHAYKYSPSTCCMLFSRLSLRLQRICGGQFIKKLLLELTNWPYQHFFMQAAMSFSGNIALISDSWLLEIIIEKASTGWKDYDYQELVTELWNLLGGLSRSNLRILVESVFSHKYEPMILFILAKIPDVEKEQLLMSFVQYPKSASTFLEKDFWIFKMVVRGLGMHSKDLLVRFKDLFGAHFTHYHPSGVHEESNINVSQFLEIVDEIIAEKDASDASET